MTRLFIALKIPLYIRKEIVNFTKEFLPGYEKYKWEQLDKVHLTLKFIGDIKEELITSNKILSYFFNVNQRKKYKDFVDSTGMRFEI